MSRSRNLLICVLLAAGGLPSGCKNSPTAEKSTPGTLRPADFAVKKGEQPTRALRSSPPAHDLRASDSDRRGVAVRPPVVPIAAGDGKPIDNEPAPNPGNPGNSVNPGNPVTPANPGAPAVVTKPQTPVAVPPVAPPVVPPARPVPPATTQVSPTLPAIPTAPAARPPAVPLTVTDKSPEDKARDSLVMDAMVGQVSGKPIYASEIFNEVGVELLERLGQNNPRATFRERSGELLFRTLSQKVDDQLILAEAERGLTEQHMFGIMNYVRTYRESLINKYGNGATTIADTNLRKETRFGLEETMQRVRQSLLVRRYLEEKVNPKIHVTRRDVERFYADNNSRFNPPPSVTVRVILVGGTTEADAVDKELAAGKSFEDVARQYSLYKREEGGQMKVGESLDKFAGLKWDAVNQEVRKLTPGKATGRIKADDVIAWVQVADVQTGKGQSLSDVFLEIEEELKNMQKGQLTRSHLVKLKAEGNYTPIKQMTQSLLDVAMSRYARPQ